MRRYLLVTPALKNRILRCFACLKFAEQRRRKALFGKQRHDDDVLSVHPRTLAELKRRGYGGAG
jgi:hypothetical protein